MILQFTKRTDGGALLRCVRDDGSVTWQKQQGNHATFFPLHDLTHYAVETELSFGRGFYGLIAAGWDIEETTGKTARGPLPDEAIEVEYIVSALAAERVSGAVSTAEELTEADLTRVRSRMDELFLRWRTLAPGDTLELAFPTL